MLLTFKQPKSFLQKMCVVALFALLWPVSTLAFLSNIQTAPTQQLQAGFLSLESIDSPAEIVIEETGIEQSFVLPIETTAASVPAVYDIEVTAVTGETMWCESLSVTATSTAGLPYVANLVDFSTTPEVLPGDWLFSVQNTAVDGIAHGASCTAELTITTWQDNLPKNIGYTDQQKIEMVIINHTPPPIATTGVVLNEIYPNEDSEASAPLEREWIELYNSGDTSVDVTGWKLGELTSGTGPETLHTINAANTCEPGAKVGYARPHNAASTIIPPGGLLLIEFCAANRLFNAGDTITLYNHVTAQTDQHTYPDTITGKSHARIPDGATWVDPTPTPGVTNTVTVSELRAEGWSDAKITQAKEVVIDYQEYFKEMETISEVNTATFKHEHVPIEEYAFKEAATDFEEKTTSEDITTSTDDLAVNEDNMKPMVADTDSTIESSNSNSLTVLEEDTTAEVPQVTQNEQTEEEEDESEGDTGTDDEEEAARSKESETGASETDESEPKDI